jgi:hypothetical protein
MYTATSVHNGAKATPSQFMDRGALAIHTEEVHRRDSNIGSMAIM